VNGRPIREYFGMDQAVLIAEEPLKAYTAGRQDQCGCGGLRWRQERAGGSDEARPRQGARNTRPFAPQGAEGRRVPVPRPRMKERKKYGQPGARKRFQFSKR